MPVLPVFNGSELPQSRLSGTVNIHACIVKMNACVSVCVFACRAGTRCLYNKRCHSAYCTVITGDIFHSLRAIKNVNLKAKRPRGRRTGSGLRKGRGKKEKNSVEWRVLVACCSGSQHQSY